MDKQPKRKRFADGEGTHGEVKEADRLLICYEGEAKRTPATVTATALFAELGADARETLGASLGLFTALAD